MRDTSATSATIASIVCAVDAERIVPHQGFARQLEQDALVFRRQCAFPACAITSAAKSVDFFSMPSPTTRKA